MRARKRALQVAFFLFAALLCSASQHEPPPHRQLSTERFPGPVALNNPYRALGVLPQDGEQLARLASLLRNAGGRNSLRDLVSDLARRDPELLGTAVRLAPRLRNLALPPGEMREQIRQVLRLVEAIQQSPFRGAVARFAARAARRPATGPGLIARLRQLRELLARAGVPREYLQEAGSLARSVVQRSRGVLDRLQSFTRGSFTVPGGPILGSFPPAVKAGAALALCAGLLICLLSLRKRSGAKTELPPEPDLSSLRLSPERFPDLLLAFYRRALAEEGLRFRGKTLSELKESLCTVRPELEETASRLNEYFYPLYYRGPNATRAPDAVNLAAACRELEALWNSFRKHSRRILRKEAVHG